MKQSDITQLFAVPWASQADSSTVANIPVTATVIERASMAKGFPKATMTPLAAGGVPPYGEDMNGILAMLSQAARAAEVGLVRPFSQAYSDAIGGYPAGAVVLHPSISGRCVMNTWDNNTSPPPGNGWLDPLAGFVTGGPYIPSSLRSGHNDSQVNNAFYDNDNGGNLVVSVVGKGLVYIQPADDYALNSSLSGAVSALTAAISAERNRAMAVEGGLIPTQPRSGHNDSQVNNAFYDNDNGGNLVVSVVGKGLVYIQPADDYALNSSLSGAVSALTAAISAERNRAMAVEGGLIPTQPRSGHNDSQVNNAFYDNDNGGNLVVSVVGKGLVYMQPADNYACVRGTSKKTATQNFFVKPYGNVFGVTFPEPFAATDPKTEIIIQATPARVQGGTAETSTPYIYWNSVSNTGFGLDCSQNPGDVAGYYISATGPIA